LIKDRQHRLGAKGMDEILAHPFFAGLDIVKYESYKVTPPFMPEQDKDNLTQYFNVKTDEFAMSDTYLPNSKQKLIKDNQKAFAGFSKLK
jgi:hypothetical protein